MPNRKATDTIEIEAHEREGIPVVKLTGDFSGEVAYNVFDYIENNLFEKGKYSFILDLNNLKKFLSRGVAVIIELCSVIDKKKGKFVLICENDMFYEILEECHINSLAPITPDLETALAIMREQG